MALLCAAIGNGSTQLGLLEADAEEPLAEWRVASDEARTPDEWATLLRGLLAGLPSVEVEGVATCSAAPTVLHAWREMVERAYPGVPHVVVGPGVRTGLSMLVDSPREVGADRVVNALAAATAYDGPTVVVDLGVATTFEVVDEAGRYLGGAIAPGIAISLDALTRRGAQLRTVELATPRSVVARNTVEALQAGMVFGFAALIDGMVARIESELGQECRTVVATGPLAPVVLGTCARVSMHSPWLTLFGLQQVFNKNQ